MTKDKGDFYTVKHPFPQWNGKCHLLSNESSGEICNFQDVSIFVFDKKSVDRLHKPRRKEAMTELLKNGLGHLMCFRHPKMLHVVHGPEENSDTLAFASEPLIGSLANILSKGLSGALDQGEKSNHSNSSNHSMLKIEYSFIDVEYRYGFSQVSCFFLNNGFEFLCPSSVNFGNRDM